jgi:hypothetical protein
LLLVDGFIANGSHVDDNLTLADFLARGAQFQARHLPLYDGTTPDDRPALAKFVQLPTALRSSADTIVWAVGPTELRAGLSLADYRSELAFLAAATLARGKLPLLVSPPIVGDLTQERLRPYALALKEIAAAYDLPVVDLYSASLKRQNIDEYYRVQGRDDLLSATPNAKGREWLLRQVEATLVQYRQERP